MLSRENQLLAYSTHRKFSASSHQDISRLLQQPLDWDKIVASASWYAVKPLVYRCLRDNPARQRVPQEVMQQLKKAYDDTTVRNMYIYAALSRVLPQFELQGIKCIVLKGAMLADTVYGDIGLRPMQDIDLLFNKKDIFKAIAILSELGYVYEGNQSLQFYLDTHFHITYTHPDTDIPIEIHWHIARDGHPQRLRLTENELIERWFERAQPVILSKVDAWTLCPTDLILHLCLHFLKHRVPRNRALFSTSAALLQLSDIVQTIYYFGDKIDWDDLRHQTYKYHITDLVYTTIKIALETCVNKDDNNSLNLRISDGRYRYKKLMYQRLMLHDDMTRAIPDELRLSIVSHNLRSFLRAVIRWLFPAKETLATRYSVPESANRMYVYYLINPYNLLNTIVLFFRQIPRLSHEIRLNKWISG